MLLPGPALKKGRMERINRLSTNSYLECKVPTYSIVEKLTIRFYYI